MPYRKPEPFDVQFIKDYLSGKASALTDPRAAKLDYKSMISLFNLISFPAAMTVVANQSPDAAKAFGEALFSTRFALPLFPTVGALIMPNLIYELIEGPGRRYTGNLPFGAKGIPVPVVGSLPRQYVVIGIALLWFMQTLNGIFAQLESDNGLARFLKGFYSDSTAVLAIQPILMAFVGALVSGMIAVGKTWLNGTSQWNVDQFADGFVPGAKSRLQFEELPDAYEEPNHTAVSINDNDRNERPETSLVSQSRYSTFAVSVPDEKSAKFNSLVLGTRGPGTR